MSGNTVEGLKRCGRCREYKTRDAFSLSRGAKDGKQGYCKTCSSQVMRKRAYQNPPPKKPRLTIDVCIQPGCAALAYGQQDPHEDGECDPRLLEEEFGPVPVVQARPPDPDWAKQAACLGDEDPDEFFRWKLSDRVAKVCRSCPVRAECVRDSLRQPPAYQLGWRANMSPHQRETLRRRLAESGVVIEPARRYSTTPISAPSIPTGSIVGLDGVEPNDDELFALEAAMAG